MSPFIELFITGVTISFGPCLASCSPLILPYIAATRQGWRKGLEAILVFSLARLLVYIILGFLSGLIGKGLLRWFDRFDYLVFFGGGLLVSLLGLFIIFEREHHGGICRILRRDIIEGGLKDCIMLGLMVSILPCWPLLGVLAYIGLRTEDLWQGAFYGLVFGLGNFISPLILLGVLAGSLSDKLIKRNRIYGIFQRVCGFVLFFIGINLIVSRL
jgi:sulfite exporter TauE/SafE